MEDTGKLEERNKIVSELQTIIKERIELKEIEIPGTITFQVMSVDGGNVPVGAGEVLLLRYSATHLEYSHVIWNTVMSWKTRTRSFIWQFISFIVKSRKVCLEK